MRTPPPLAERLLRWSLTPDDREAVLGDLHEEFAGLVDLRGAPAATRWYWIQALLSLPPNVIRRLRGDRQRRLAAETREERETRHGFRRTGLLMSASGVLAMVLAFFTAERTGGLLLPFLTVIAGVLLVFGTTLFFGSLSPRPEYDRLTYQLNRRRSGIVWLLFILATLPDKIAPTLSAHVVKIWEFLPMLAGVAIALWPRKYWIFGGVSAELRRPRVWSPFSSTRREVGGSLLLPVDAPDGPAKLGDLILGRDGESRIEIRRVFGSDAHLRVFAAVGRSATPLSVVIDLFDSHDHHVSRRPAPTTDATAVSGTEWWRRPVPATAVIDETIPLDGCRVGSYRVVVTASDGCHTSTKAAEFRIGPPASQE